MRTFASLLLFASSFLCSGAVAAQEPAAKPVPATDSGLTGRWIVNSDFYGTTLYFGLELEQKDDKLTGTFDGDHLEGTLTGKTSILWPKTSMAEPRKLRRQ